MVKLTWLSIIIKLSRSQNIPQIYRGSKGPIAGAKGCDTPQEIENARQGG